MQAFTDRLRPFNEGLDLCLTFSASSPPRRSETVGQKVPFLVTYQSCFYTRISSSILNPQMEMGRWIRSDLKSPLKLRHKQDLPSKLACQTCPDQDPRSNALQGEEEVRPHHKRGGDMPCSC